MATYLELINHLVLNLNKARRVHGCPLQWGFSSFVLARDCVLFKAGWFGVWFLSFGLHCMALSRLVFGFWCLGCFWKVVCK